MGWIVTQLRGGRRLRARDVADKFEISERTAYRDFDFVRDQMRAPIEFDRREGTWILKDRDFQLPELALSSGELMALCFAEKVLEQYRGTPFERDLESAFRKLQDRFPEEISVRPHELEATLSLDLGPIAAPDPELFRALIDALLQRRAVSVRYRSLSGGRTSDRVVEPYRLYNLRGSWYMAARDQGRRQVRDFALPRVEAVRVLGERYQIPESWTFERYMKGSFRIEKGGTPTLVQIRFAPRQAPWIREKAWHPTARIRDTQGGGCILTMRVAGLGEVKSWVLQFGAEAEVLKPHALRLAVRRELLQMRRLYRP
jgi:predicted DNA-binding transcriptional regulator YafY